MQRLVSVIIPCYNAAAYLTKTLHSVESQTYCRIEVILINDGSTDSTIEICNSYKDRSRFPVKVLDGPNGGVSVARNKGIIAAEGEYLSFLDADDSLAKDAIKVLVETIETTGADTVYGVWSRNIRSVEEKHNIKCKEQDVYAVMSIYMKKIYPVAFFNFLYKRKVIDKNNIEFSTGLRYGEDNLFFWKYLCYVNKAVFINVPLYWYNDNEESAMHKTSWNNSYALEAIYTAERYMKHIDFKYISVFSSFMPARTMLSIAKEYSKHGDREIYEKFLEKYPVKKCAKTLLFKDNLKITIAAFIMTLSPRSFYLLFHDFLKF